MTLKNIIAFGVFIISIEICIFKSNKPGTYSNIFSFCCGRHIWLVARRPTAIATWASCQICKIAGAHAPGMPGTFSPSPQVSDPDMHHGTCVMHVPWCMPGWLTSGFLWNRRQGETFPAFPGHAQPAILRIWYEAHQTVVCWGPNKRRPWLVSAPCS